MMQHNLAEYSVLEKQTPGSVLIVSILLLSACQTAFLTFPGGALKGDEAKATSFSFANEFNLLQLETRPDDPYSIWLRVTVLDGELYIDAAENRRWHLYLSENPNIRIKLGDKIYRAIANRICDGVLEEKFLTGRTIYRIDPIP